MSHLILYLTLMGSLVLAGCAQPGPFLDSSGASTGSISTNATTTTAAAETGANTTYVPSPSIREIPRRAVWNECSSVATVRTYANAAGPGKPPADWSENPFFHEVTVLLYECKRVSWGTFERPLRILLEVHSNLRAPEKCAAGTYTRMHALQKIMVDDPEIRAFLANTYGMEVLLANFTRVESFENQVRTVEWTWVPAGFQNSWVQAQEVEQENTTQTFIDRMAWAKGSGVAFMNITVDETWSTAPLVATPGEMRPPMLSAQDTPYVGRGQLNTAAPARLDFTFFADTKCEEPIR